MDGRRRSARETKDESDGENEGGENAMTELSKFNSTGGCCSKL